MSHPLLSSTAISWLQAGNLTGKHDTKSSLDGKTAPGKTTEACGKQTGKPHPTSQALWDRVHYNNCKSIKRTEATDWVKCKQHANTTPTFLHSSAVGPSIRPLRRLIKAGIFGKWMQIHQVVLFRLVIALQNLLNSHNVPMHFDLLLSTLTHTTRLRTPTQEILWQSSYASPEANLTSTHGDVSRRDGHPLQSNNPKWNADSHKDAFNITRCTKRGCLDINTGFPTNSWIFTRDDACYWLAACGSANERRATDANRLDGNGPFK